VRLNCFEARLAQVDGAYKEEGFVEEEACQGAKSSAYVYCRSIGDDMYETFATNLSTCVCELKVNEARGWVAGSELPCATVARTQRDANKATSRLRLIGAPG
jgi:hypothetical protein